jgi:hypothetical protein
MFSSRIGRTGASSEALFETVAFNARRQAKGSTFARLDSTKSVATSPYSNNARMIGFPVALSIAWTYPLKTTVSTIPNLSETNIS